MDEYKGSLNYMKDVMPVIHRRAGVEGALTTAEVHKVWSAYELSTRAVTTLGLAGCRTPEQVRAVGEDEFGRIPNCGKLTVKEIGDVVLGGWEPPPKARSVGVSPIADERVARRIARSLESIDRTLLVIATYLERLVP